MAVLDGHLQLLFPPVGASPWTLGWSSFPGNLIRNLTVISDLIKFSLLILIVLVDEHLIPPEIEPRSGQIT